MGNLGDVLKNRIKAMGVERQVEAAGVVEAAQKEIAKHIFEEDFEVISFNRGVLKIRVASSVVASELLTKRVILTKKNNVKKIITLIK